MRIFKETNLASGGNLFTELAIGAATAVEIHNIPGQLTGQTTQEWGAGVGSAIGEATYNFINPDPLGQMVYYPDQFKLSYIAPAPVAVWEW